MEPPEKYEAFTFNHCKRTQCEYCRGWFERKNGTRVYCACTCHTDRYVEQLERAYDAS